MSVTERLAEFALWALAEGPWSGRDLDGAAVEEKALALGLIKEVAHNPALHGTEPWVILTHEVMAVLPKKKGPGVWRPPGLHTHRVLAGSFQSEYPA